MTKEVFKADGEKSPPYPKQFAPSIGYVHRASHIIHFQIFAQIGFDYLDGSHL